VAGFVGIIQAIKNSQRLIQITPAQPMNESGFPYPRPPALGRSFPPRAYHAQASAMRQGFQAVSGIIRQPNGQCTHRILVLSCHFHWLDMVVALSAFQFPYVQGLLHSQPYLGTVAQ
jgi:hypothetical protein